MDECVLQYGDVKLEDVLFCSVERDVDRVDTLTYSGFFKPLPEYAIACPRQAKGIGPLDTD